MIVSEANLTEDLEQFESEETFLTPFVTGPFLIIPLVAVAGLAVGFCFSEGAEGYLSSCRISSWSGLEVDIRVSVLSSSVSSAGGSELKLEAGLAGLGEVEVDILEMADAGLDLSTKCWSVSPAARLTAEAGLCLKRSLMFA